MTDCLFCRIVTGEIPADKVHEDDGVLAFRDITPQAPQHILIIPKAHISSTFTCDDSALLGKMVITAAQIAEKIGISQSGYRLVNNHGRDGGQTVSHLHFHLLGGRQMQWPPG